jgi:hypothetical protein
MAKRGWRGVGGGQKPRKLTRSFFSICSVTSEGVLSLQQLSTLGLIDRHRPPAPSADAPPPFGAPAPGAKGAGLGN